MSVKASFMIFAGTLVAATPGCSDDVSGSGGGLGGGGASPTAPPGWDRPVTKPSDADAAAARAACQYQAGALPAETQGASRPSGDEIPVDHILIVMQENRSFDHYFQKLPEAGQPDVDVAPPTFTNPDAEGNAVAPFKVVDHCFVDTNHEWDGSHEQYADGAMSGFILTNENHGTPPPHPKADSMSGLRAMQYYDQAELPFYYWLANEFAIGDRYFCSLLGPTWPNRMYLYAASSRGMTENKIVSFLDTHEGSCATDEECGLDAPVGTCDKQAGTCAPIGRTIFDYLEQRKIDWKVYSEGTPGWLMTFDAWSTYQVEHQKTLADYYADAAAGTLPQVAFIDSLIGYEAFDGNDEHPPGTPFLGELFTANVVDALTKSPNWSRSALFVTYDEHGGLYDHVPPPNACPPGDFPAELAPGGFPGEFDRYGFRVPLFVVSPYAKKHFVSHQTYDHTSIMRFIQARFVLPAITNRDANAEAPWDMFDFASPPHASPPAIPIPTGNQAQIDECASIWAE